MTTFDKMKLAQFFAAVGGDLKSRGIPGEIEVHGGAALILMFDWAASSDDFDIIIREGENQAEIRRVVAAAASRFSLPPAKLGSGAIMRLGLPKSELNKFLLGSYPADDAAGLKVYLVTPEYLFGTWLKAIAAGVETYLTETIMLGVELGVTSMEHINGYARLYLGDALQSEHAQRRAKDLLAAITKRRKLVFASE